MPTADNPRVPIVNAGTDTPVVEVTGTGEPDSTADIIIGDPITTTTDDPGDTLGTEIEGGDIPADGQYDDISVVVTVDVAPLCIEITTGPVYVGDVVNADEAKAGFAITGAS
ncbi:hypothetical protein AL035_21620, partial [Salipiger aestuarii]